MSFSSQVARALDEEHRNNLAVLDKVENALMRSNHAEAPFCAVMAQFALAMEHDIERHFRFEEESLFPLMRDAGDGDMADLMVEEHAVMREIASDLLPLARAAAAGPITDMQWAALKQNALEMIERQVAHIQKETMSLLPMLSDLLDAGADQTLTFSYAGDA